MNKKFKLGEDYIQIPLKEFGSLSIGKHIVREIYKSPYTKPENSFCRTSLILDVSGNNFSTSGLSSHPT